MQALGDASFVAQVIPFQVLVLSPVILAGVRGRLHVSPHPFGPLRTPGSRTYADGYGLPATASPSASAAGAGAGPGTRGVVLGGNPRGASGSAPASASASRSLRGPAST